MTKDQHNFIEHAKFQLRKAKRDRKANPGRYYETEVSWAEHELAKAQEEAS